MDSKLHNQNQRSPYKNEVMKFLKKLKARINGAPFFIKEHWPQYYPQCGYDFLGDKRFTVTLFDHYSKEGDVVEVLTLGEKIHRYTITRISYAPGGDWGPYSNKQFDLLYHSTIKMKP
jgi:hypothetical protein